MIKYNLIVAKYIADSKLSTSLKLSCYVHCFNNNMNKICVIVCPRLCADKLSYAEVVKSPMVQTGLNGRSPLMACENLPAFSAHKTNTKRYLSLVM